MVNDEHTEEGAPVPSELPTCADDEFSEVHSATDVILARLNEMLGDTGGAYSPNKMPIRQAIQYSLIALNKQINDSLMEIVGVLASNIVGRVQFCEDAIASIMKPQQRTIRGLLKRSENGLKYLIGHLGQTICARTAYSQQMLADCQCKMLGGSALPETAPVDDGDLGIPSKYPSVVGDGGMGTPLAHYVPTLPEPVNTPSDCEQWDLCRDGNIWKLLVWFISDEWPKLIQVLDNKRPIIVNVHTGQSQAAVEMQAQEQLAKIVQAANSQDPDAAMQELFGTQVGQAPPRPDVGLTPHQIDDEHYPIEELPDQGGVDG